MQKTLYLGVIVAGIVIVLSGLAMWKPVQLWWLTALFGGYDRRATCTSSPWPRSSAFLVIHIVDGVVVPKSLRAMVAGR